MEARDLMTPDPKVVSLDEPLSRVAQIMRDHDVGIVPVVDDRTSMHVLGVITDRDIVIRHVASAHHQDCASDRVMTKDHLVIVHPGDDVKAVMDMMKFHKVRRVLVTDGDDRLVGIISQADLARIAGPREPEKVEAVIEKISEPNTLRRP